MGANGFELWLAVWTAMFRFLKEKRKSCCDFNKMNLIMEALYGTEIQKNSFEGKRRSACR